jgi:hypothetical protein
MHDRTLTIQTSQRPQPKSANDDKWKWSRPLDKVILLVLWPLSQLETRSVLTSNILVHFIQQPNRPLHAYNVFFRLERSKRVEQPALETWRRPLQQSGRRWRTRILLSMTLVGRHPKRINVATTVGLRLGRLRNLQRCQTAMCNVELTDCNHDYDSSACFRLVENYIEVVLVRTICRILNTFSQFYARGFRRPTANFSTYSFLSGARAGPVL